MNLTQSFMYFRLRHKLPVFSPQTTLFEPLTIFFVHELPSAFNKILGVFF